MSAGTLGRAGAQIGRRDCAPGGLRQRRSKLTGDPNFLSIVDVSLSRYHRYLHSRRHYTAGATVPEGEDGGEIAQKIDLEPIILGHQPDFLNQVADNLRGFSANVTIQFIPKTRDLLSVEIS